MHPEGVPDLRESNHGSADGDGGIAVKKKPDPPPSRYDDDEHPLAGNYNLMAQFTLTECYVFTHQRSIAEYLLRRPCDEVIEEEKKQG